MKLRARLEDQVAMLEAIGAPALMERFVLRNARPEAPGSPFAGIRGTPKQCFMNATLMSIRTSLTYCEGYVLRAGLPIAIPHAWCMDGDKVIDPTLERPEEGSYLGVEFPTDILREETLRSGFYGILDTGRGLNHRFMFEFDPALEKIVTRVRPRINFGLDTPGALA